MVGTIRTYNKGEKIPPPPPPPSPRPVRRPKKRKPTVAEASLLKMDESIRSIQDFAGEGDNLTIRDEIEFAKLLALKSIAVSLLHISKQHGE